MNFCFYPNFELRGYIKRTLSPQEGLVMLALLGNKTITRESLADIIWPDPNNTPLGFDLSISRIINRLRVKLSPFEWTIPRLEQEIYHIIAPGDPR